MATKQYTLGIINFIVAVINGWAMKSVPDDGRYSLTKLAFSALLVQSLFGFLYSTHPSKQISSHSYYNKIEYVIQEAAQQMIIGNFLYTLNAQLDVWFWLTLLWTAINAFFDWVHWDKALKIARTVKVIWNAAALIYVITYTHQDECSWLAGLVVLILLNHFLFHRLAYYYEITHSEISTVGLGFFIIFALSAIHESHN